MFRCTPDVQHTEYPTSMQKQTNKTQQKKNPWCCNFLLSLTIVRISCTWAVPCTDGIHQEMQDWGLPSQFRLQELIPKLWNYSYPTNRWRRESYSKYLAVSNSTCVRRKKCTNSGNVVIPVCKLTSHSAYFYPATGFLLMYKVALNSSVRKEGNDQWIRQGGEQEDYYPQYSPAVFSPCQKMSWEPNRYPCSYAQISTILQKSDFFLCKRSSIPNTASLP